MQVERHHERPSYGMECDFWYVIMFVHYSSKCSILLLNTYSIKSLFSLPEKKNDVFEITLPRSPSGLVFFGFVFLTTSFFTSLFSISMGFLTASIEMGYFQFVFDIEKSSKTDLFLRFCVYLAISIGGLIVNFNFGFVLLLCALHGVLAVSGYVLTLSFLFCELNPLIFNPTFPG